jgi:two-component system CheB/CheR fusion protein
MLRLPYTQIAQRGETAMAEASQSKHLVVAGASAGGIEALTAFLAEMPREFAAPIVIAQHLDPSRPSHLADILSRRSPLPVRTITESEALQPGIVYVVPSNRHVHIRDSHLQLSQEDSNRSKPSIDYLFSTAAQRFGEGLIAVVLTGTGSDGAAGARAVKEAGGTVIIQDPATAAYPGMPLSLAPTIVDIVAPVERMGRILGELVNGAKAPTQPDERELLDGLLQDVRERLGLDFNSYKTPTILRRLQRRVVATDSDDLQGYIDYLHAHPEEYQNLTNAFLIKVTEFLRDPDLYTYLRETVVPDLVTQSRKRGNELRIWSAGSATGEEAYSLAIVISEVLGAALEHFNVRVFATDADGDAIAFARRGIYPAAAVARLPEDLMAKYFTREDGNYQIRKRIRAMTVFGQHDLGGRAPFPHTDMIVCRNVLIYFTPDLQQRTLKLFAYSLRDGGYLVLGKAETPGQMSDFFEPENKLLKVYRRHGDRILIPPARTSEVFPASPQRLPMTRRTPGGLAFSGGQRDLQRIRTSADTLLLRVPVGVVVVDRHYDIQVINSAARRFLSIHGSAVGEDLIHVEQGIPTAELREAIDQAFRAGQQMTLEEVAVEEVGTSEPRYLHISCIAQPSDGERSAVDSIMVVVQDVTAQAQARRAAEQQLRTTTETLQQLRQESETRASEREQLVQRLVETNRQLIEANQELTSTNEELRTTNEQSLLSAEEAQAAIEEVETLNEELQATNEELETLNEELQATIEELNATNDDLNARTVELQELAAISEQERARLETIVRSISDAVLVVNSAGAPQLKNAAYDRIFGEGAAPFVAEDENGVPLPPEQTPQQRIARGETFSVQFAAVAANGTRHWFEANGQAIEGGNRSLGGVVVIRDITARSPHAPAE